MTFPQAIHFIIAEAVRFVTPMGLAAEWVLLAVGALLVLAFPVFVSDAVSRVRLLFLGLANRRMAAICACAALPVLLRLSLLGLAPVPTPSIHDEFSHLLLADTLAHGRLTNPTPAHWRHFESIHEIQQPTYNSMYLPAQGAFLALGQKLFRHPWAGVEISVALMCAAMCWMLQGWISPAWAMWGTLMAVLKIGVVGFWVNSYMGGSVPALGGALLIGALPRLKRGDPRLLPSFMLGLGVVILMNSRPFEGGVLTLAAVLYLSPSIIRGLSRNPGNTLRIVLGPAMSVILFGSAFLGYYCWRVTGNPLRFPYQVNRDTYGWPENLAFLPPKIIKSPHPILQKMYELEIHHRDIYGSFDNLLDNLNTRVFQNWAYLVGPVLTLPFLLPFFRRDRRIRPLLFFFGAIAFLNLFQMLLYPYHLGPVIPIVFAIIAVGGQQIYSALSMAQPVRAGYFACILPFLLVLVAAMKQEAQELDIPYSSYWEQGYEAHRDARASILNWLRSRPGRHLVIVRYQPSHSVNQEWVYNGADIEGSKIVWAREMDTASNTELVDHFSDRQAWLLEADVNPVRVVPYPDAHSYIYSNSDSCLQWSLPAEDGTR
jgi:hypothetical protein